MIPGYLEIIVIPGDYNDLCPDSQAETVTRDTNREVEQGLDWLLFANHDASSGSLHAFTQALH